ncbi:MAG TPA: hypothetical protein VFA26_14225 [Gemmataceae bacterium]|nr:hypothetical protein [Gemmataceae bacterium]
MQAYYGGVAALVVAALYWGWRAWSVRHREQVLRERVAFMLWVMANQVE